MNDHDLRILKSVLAGYHDEGWGYWQLGRSIDLLGIGTVTVVEHQQGSTTYDDGTPTVIIFKVGRDQETLFFRKSGYVDSYSYDINWTGEFCEVRPVEKVTYDYV